MSHFDNTVPLPSIDFPRTSANGPALMPSTTPHVLFVCTGNTCRSPMAEAYFRQELSDRTDISVSSAGVSAYPGSPASEETIAFVEEANACLGGFSSRQVDQKLVCSASHIFCLTKRHARTLLSAFPELKDTKVYLVGDFVELDGRVGSDIPDPYGMGPDAYELVSNILKKAAPNLVRFVEQSTVTA